jgi:predicted PurR-regulated permease PerM
MSTTQPQADSPVDPSAEPPAEPFSWVVFAQRLAFWGLILGVLYLTRDFFFTAFMTFLFSYLTLMVVNAVMARLSPGKELPWLRLVLTLGVFVLVPLILFAVFRVIGPPLFHQGEELVGWVSQLDPHVEVSRLVERYVGPEEFRNQYGGPGDPRYQKALEEFRATGASHVAAYRSFPQMESWVEGPFAKQFDASTTQRIRIQLAHEGVSSEAFARWFLQTKAPELQAQAKEQVPSTGRPPASVPPLVVAAATATPKQLLEHVRQTPEVLVPLRDEWINDTIRSELAREKASPEYLAQLQAYYERKRLESPKSLPYPFDVYADLRKARSLGMKAFGEAMEKVDPRAEEDREAKSREDFETAKQHELFQKWWSENAHAHMIRHVVDSTVGTGQTEQLDRKVTALLGVPASLCTALLLSLFICLDFPRLREGVRGVRSTWLRDIYDEVVPAFASVGQLIGRAMLAQGLIALCNATLLFVALSLLGVAHPLLLSAVAFVLCLVPTLGLVIAWVLIAVVALIQPGGGVGLALQASGAVVGIVLIEIFVLSPRILGRMMELHPVLIMALLPIAQYFFGIWGLILATPVAVYVIYERILCQGLPGARKDPEPTPHKETPATPEPVHSEDREHSLV